MPNVAKTIIALCSLSLIAFIIWVIPVSDKEKCGEYEPYRGKDDVLMCWCNGREKAKPGKCGSKYK